MPNLNEQDVLDLLGPNSPLATLLNGFEARPQQQEMMRDVLKAYNEKGISLIEAGTGTGKSLAYLIPAVLWAQVNGDRTVISTKTIALQEQLFHKDIPLVSKIIGCELKAVIVKGMSNYLCLRKLIDAQSERANLSQAEHQDLEKIEAWAQQTKDGSKSSIPFIPHHSTWEKVCAESDTCTNVKCEFYKECHFFKAREEANDAQILIANHHLLFADLSRRFSDDNYESTALLPLYTSVVLDEAHHIEEVATEYFAARASRLDLVKTLARIASEKGIKIVGKLSSLRDQFAMHFARELPENCRSLHQRLNVDLPGLRRDLQDHIHSAFAAYELFVSMAQANVEELRPETEHTSKENKLRVFPHHKNHPHWKSLMEDSTNGLADSLKRFVQALNAVEKDLKFLDDEKLNEKTKTIRFELASLAKRLSDASDSLLHFFSDLDNPNKVQWIENHSYKTMTNTTLVNAELDIAKSLAATLFSKFKSIVLCSATLTTNNNFDFIKRSLGITPELIPQVKVYESIYESPFDYSKQVLFTIPTDIPLPQDPKFNKVASEKIWHAIQASRGNAFVLFTSFHALQQCHRLLHDKLVENRYIVLKHGDENRQTLIHKFKANNRSVLFGTDTFWEGVDVVGEALRCVIIVKLPFKVPSEPIIQARTESIQSRGGDPFREYSLPNAIVKFKQGVGRLIRNKNDRGCIVCLDGRLIHKKYGEQFLKSIPDCERVFGETEEMVKAMGSFYKRTHYLTFQGNKK